MKIEYFFGLYAMQYKQEYTFIYNRFRHYLYILLFIFPVNLFSQSTTNISGIINAYYTVTEVMPSLYALKVTNPAGLGVNNRVLIVQMKGAVINTGSGSSFGDTTDLNEAGNYETAVICKIKTDTVYFHHTFLNSYLPATGMVQMVKMAEYYSANVIDTLKAAPWNNSTGTGGVIALFCSQDLTLNAPIYADSSGYRGGAFVTSSGTCSNFLPANAYYYNAANNSPQNGAWKGEGAATVLASQSGGRGAPANGGGGGNNHNNSGGGGANLTGGGIGGGNSSSAGCTTTLRGLAGKALSSWGGSKIFMGGGGGAGHSNGAVYTKGGGNGGGIIFIHANNINGNGYTISANGGTGGQALSDGAGGGGAGGTIISDISTYTGSLTIEANGGNGGNSDDGGTVGRCYGGGGGGSGGIIYLSGSLPAITLNVNGGIAGNETGRNATCAAAEPAGTGSSGQVIQNYLYKRSTDPASNCGIALPVTLYYFRSEIIRQHVLLSWKVSEPGLINYFIVEKKTGSTEWQSLQQINAETATEIYSALDNKPVAGKNYYRLKIIERDHKTSFSAIKLADLFSSENDFSFFPNPARNSITIKRNKTGSADLKLMDLSGRLIIQKQVNAGQTEINLPALLPGIYILHLSGINKKLVIH